MKSVIALLCLLLNLGLASMTQAQPAFGLRVLNPSGFVAPGQSEDILVEVSNPADSGVSITRFSGAGRQGGIRLSPADMQAMGERMMQRARQRAEAGQAGGCNDFEICPVSGTFPIEPGQSMTIRYHRFEVPADTPVDTEIKFSRLSLKIEISDENFNNPYYTDKDVIRLVTPGGQGDFSIFDAMNLESELAGTLSSNLRVTFDAPNEITAGQRLSISARITNQGEAPILLHNAIGSSVSGFDSVLGAHSRSFRFIPCAEDCLLDGSPSLDPGDSISYIIGTYYYENEELFDGEFILDSYRLYVGDNLGRDGFSSPQDSPLKIIVSSGYSGVAKNDLNPLSTAQPLEQTGVLHIEDSQIIYDPNSGNEWLPLTASKGFTDEEMQAELKPGGLFEYFRIASSAEVEELILNHVHSTGHNLGDYALFQTSDSETNVALISLLDMFGRIDSPGSSIGAIGRISDINLGNINSMGDLPVIQIEVNEALAAISGAVLRSSVEGLRKYAISKNRANYNFIGYWLVR